MGEEKRVRNMTEVALLLFSLKGAQGQHRERGGQA